MNIQHINHQQISKRDHQQDGLLHVHSIFKTIQGEGPFCGHPAIFVRLQGCNLQCPGCDTEYTTPRPGYAEPLKATTVLGEVELAARGTNISLIVITGGEPFRQNIGPFAKAACKLGYTVQVETNGTMDPGPDFPTWSTGRTCVVVSPKAGKVRYSIASIASAYKYVLHHESIHTDGLPLLALGHSAVPHVARPPADYAGPIYLQPMDCQDPVENKKNIDAVVKSCEKHGYILQLQIHKYLGVE